MKITPIKNHSIYAHNTYYKNNIHNGRIKSNNNFYIQSFKGSYDSKITTEISNIRDSCKYKNEIKALKENSLLKEVSFDDFLASAMRLTNKYSSTFPIKEDFFEYKAKNRFIEIIKKCLSDEVENYINPEKLYEFIDHYYWWGFNDKKFGSSSAFTVNAACVLPYAKQYERELQISKLEHLTSRENTYRKALQVQEHELKNKEFINETYFQPLITSKNDPTISLPNAIMIEGGNPKDSEDLISWALSKTPSNKIVVENDKSSNNTLIKNRLKSALEKSRQTFEDYRIPTIIYCEEFDRLVQSSNPPVEIASMKALLSNTYSKYGATIIFSTQNSNKIDNVIKQPHRMKSINIDN